MVKARLLLLGLDPDIVDYSKSPVPGLTAAKVRSAIEADRANLEALGYSVKTLYVDEGKTAETVLASRRSSPQKSSPPTENVGDPNMPSSFAALVSAINEALVSSAPA